MKLRALTSLLVLVGCATDPETLRIEERRKAIRAEQDHRAAHANDPPPAARPDFWALDRACGMEPLARGVWRIACNWIAGAPAEDMLRIARYKAGVLGVYVEREGFAAVVGKAPAGSYWLHAYYPEADAYQADKAANTDRNVMYATAAEVVAPQSLTFFRERHEAEKESEKYAKCRAFVLDIDAAAKEPGRTTACNNLMAVIDRKRQAPAPAAEPQLDGQDQYLRLKRAQILQNVAARPSPGARCRPDASGGLDCVSR